MKAKLLGNKYHVFINGVLIVSGQYISKWAAFLDAANKHGMDRDVGSVTVKAAK